jgi:hypothetical protein
MTYLLIQASHPFNWRNPMIVPDTSLSTARVPSSAPPPAPAEKRLLTGKSSAERKQYPIVTGCLDYFPDALAEVSHISYLGNEKHNPGQPLHWARGKSSDHDDCVGRHLTERGTLEPDTQAEVYAQVAWRALAALQEYLEKKYGLSLPKGATAAGVELPRR